MTIKIEYGEAEIRDLIVKDLEDKLGNIAFDRTDIEIMVKSKQNYRSEWEHADFKAIYHKV